MNSGKLDIIIGCMFSGKSSELIKRLTTFAEIGMKILYINHSLDKRNNHVVSTHHPFITPTSHDNIEFKSFPTLKGLRCEDYDVIGIDEGQFFDSSLIEFVRVHVEQYGKYVLVCGLDGNFKREKFGFILDLIPIADTITKLRSYCFDCGIKKEKAIFTYRCSEDNEVISVGSKDKYKPLCRACYLKY